MIVVTSYKNVLTVAVLSSLLLLLTFIATPTHLAFAHHTTEGKREEVKQRFNNFIRNIELKISS